MSSGHRSSPPERISDDAYVSMLPRRQAHAMYALFVTTKELRMPPTAAEICIYDEEAISVKATAAALREASKKGLCFCIKGTWWVAGSALHMGHHPFERCWARDTDPDYEEET